MNKLLANMTDQEIMTAVADNANYMIHHNPLMGIMFQYIPLKAVTNIPTMAVITQVAEVHHSRPRFYIGYNIDFIRKACFIGEVDGRHVNTLEGLLCHEVAHVLLMHPRRRTQANVDSKRWGVATDITINDHLEGRLPAGGAYSGKFGLPKGQTAEWYYNNITQAQADEYSGFDDHDSWGDLSDEEVEELAEAAQAIARESVNKAKSQGNGSYGMMEMIEARWKPQLNWQNLLKYYIGQHQKSHSEPTFKRPNRKEQALFLDRANPGLRMYKGEATQYKLKPLVALDTSGSVSSEEISKIYSELIPLSRQFAFDICQFDHSLTVSPTEFRNGGALKVHGRGGTNFNIPINTAVEHKYDLVIVCTDGECGYPQQPKGLEAIWLMTRDYVAPWGKSIRIT